MLFGSFPGCILDLLKADGTVAGYISFVALFEYCCYLAYFPVAGVTNIACLDMF